MWKDWLFENLSYRKIINFYYLDIFHAVKAKNLMKKIFMIL